MCFIFLSRWGIVLTIKFEHKRKNLQNSLQFWRFHRSRILRSIGLCSLVQNNRIRNAATTQSLNGRGFLFEGALLPQANRCYEIGNTARGLFGKHLHVCGKAGVCYSASVQGLCNYSSLFIRDDSPCTMQDMIYGVTT